MNYYGGYSSPAMQTTTTDMGMGSLIWLIVALVVSIIGCFVVYFLFVRKDVNTKKPFVLWLKDFLNFDKMLIEPILKIAYIFAALFITLGSFALIGTNFLVFLLTIIFGNIGARILYELALINVMIWKNTTEIKNKAIKK